MVIFFAINKKSSHYYKIYKEIKLIMPLIEKYKLLQAFASGITNAEIISNYVTSKNAITVTVIVNLAQAAGHTK
jgi:hypothetical protein